MDNPVTDPITLDTVLVPETTFRSGIKRILERNIAEAEQQILHLPPFNRITLTFGPRVVDIEAWMAQQVLCEILSLDPKIQVPPGKSLDLLDEVMTPAATYRDAIFIHLDKDLDLVDSLLACTVDFVLRIDGTPYPVSQDLAKAAAIEWFEAQAEDAAKVIAGIKAKMRNAKQ